MISMLSSYKLTKDAKQAMRKWFLYESYTDPYTDNKHRLECMVIYFHLLPCCRIADINTPDKKPTERKQRKKNTNSLVKYLTDLLISKHGWTFYSVSLTPLCRDSKRFHEILNSEWKMEFIFIISRESWNWLTIFCISLLCFSVVKNNYRKSTKKK